MQVGHPSNSAAPVSFNSAATHRSYIPSLIPPGVDPAKVDSKMFYTYVPNTIKTRKRTTPAQLEILEGVFVTDKKPNAPRRKELAKKLKMSPREVQVWFQNRRAKEKKANGRVIPSAPSPISIPTSAVLVPPVAASPLSDIAPDVLADPMPSSASASPVTKVEPQTPEPSPRASLNASWQPVQLPTPPITDSFDQPHHHPHSIPSSPPDASPGAYGHRRSSLPVLSLVPPQEPVPPQLPSSALAPHSHHSLSPNDNRYPNMPPSFPSGVFPPQMLHHRRSTSALSQHPYALPIRRSSARVDYPPPSGPPPPTAPYLRASISEGMDTPALPTGRFASSGGMAGHGPQVHNSTRYHPFQTSSRRPNLAHRASVPAIFHNAHQSGPPPPLPSLPATPTSTVSLEEQQQQQQHQGGEMFAPAQGQDSFLWNNPDPFGSSTPAVALTPDAGYSFGMTMPVSSYEFPERKHSVATSEFDGDYTFELDTGMYRRPVGSVVSLCGSASSAGPSLSDVTSDGLGVDANGRRWSCVSATDMLDGMNLGGGAGAGPSDGGASPPGAGSDGYTSEHGTVTYPSPTSDSERIDMGGADIGQSPIPPSTGASSELALALHSNESSPFTPPPAFKIPDADVHAPPQPYLQQQYPPYGTAPFGGGEYHTHANGYPVSGYPDGTTDAGGLYPHPVSSSPGTADDYTATTRYT
ncbi:hypothetical protein EI94DRAFT_351948 [Lactarius quietus]|nr:hypothetical protein EI94DRAFT_351948 [Lactarius quietus]